jgi:thioredoxin reductase (NADPH)
VKNDFVFAMTGYQPDIEFLAAHGITFDPETRRPYTDPDTLESTRKGMYLAGVLVAGMHTNEIFIENGRFHGRQIAEAIRQPVQKLESRAQKKRSAAVSFARFTERWRTPSW